MAPPSGPREREDVTSRMALWIISSYDARTMEEPEERPTGQPPLPTGDDDPVIDWKDGYQPIENYGLIGDLQTVALVGMDGSIDFLAFPEFDSPTIFAAILDCKKGGYFRIAPILENASGKQIYLSDTNVLLSRFLSREGVAEISDFMPVEDGPGQRIVRRAKVVRGEARLRVVCAPRFDYGRGSHRVQKVDGGFLFISEGQHRLTLRLRTSVACHVEERHGAVVGEFTLRVGESASFILEEVIEPGPSPSQSPTYLSESFKKTVNFWKSWVGRSTYEGRWREMVNRSALVLKLLTSNKHGSMVASPTFGLPEELGGERNWDYRYTWIRDASFTLYALMRLGYTGEAAAFMKWIEHICTDLVFDDGSHLQIMYGLDARATLTESVLPHLEGYKGSRPVRSGNGAASQLQLDIYGELMDSIYIYDRHGEPVSYGLWQHLVKMVDWVRRNWRRKDEGIWEIRGERQEFLYSRLMCWVAIDRGIRLAQKRSLPAPIADWRAARDEIFREIHEEFWDPTMGAFVQHKDSKNLDASNLLMPLVRFISPTDPRWLSNLRAVEHALVDDSLVFRYKVGNSAPDGLLGEEGTFCMCSFWYIECLARSGDLEKAQFLFEKMLGYSNHLGLYAEELGPRGEHLGNFPQAFTHLALVSAAYYLDRQLSRRR